MNLNASAQTSPEKLAVPTVNHQRKSSLWFGLVFLLVKKELKVRYKGSVFGYMWSMLNPLLYMCVLAFVFSHVMRFKTENYTLFILTGILAWNIFFQGVVLGTSSIVNNSSLLKKVKVPATIFPASAVGSCLVNFMLAMLPFLVISLYITKSVPLYVLLMPLVLLPYAIFVFGIGLTLGSLNVLYRDIAHMLEPVLNMVFYATPIIYPPETIPERFRWLLNANPIATYVKVIRSLMYERQIPDALSMGLVVLFALLSLGCGLFTYNKTKDKFIYRL